MNRKAENLYRKALRQLDEKDDLWSRHTALDLLEQAVELDPKHIPALLLIADINYERGNGGECLSYARRALRIDPKNTEAMNLAGKAYLLEKKLRKARQMFGQALRIDPSYMKAAHNMALADYLEGKVDKAIAGWERALTVDPDFELTLSMLIETYLMKQDMDRAIFYGERSLAVNPDNFETVQVLSQLYFMTERHGDVIRLLEREARREPIQLEIPSPYGGPLARLGKLMPRPPSFSSTELILLGLSYLKTERFGDAIGLLKGLEPILKDSDAENMPVLTQVIGGVLQPLVMAIVDLDHPVLDYIYSAFPFVGNARCALPLLADVETFLGYVRDNEVQIVRGRGIPQAHKQEMNRRFVIKDMMSPFGNLKANDQRFRFMESLLLDAGLMREGAGTVFMTEEGERYLSMPPKEQFKRLFDAWLTTRRWNELFEIEDFSIYHEDMYDEYTRADDEAKDIEKRRNVVLKHLRSFDRGKVHNFEDLLERISREDYNFLREGWEFDRFGGWRVQGGLLSMREMGTEWDDIEAPLIGFFLTGPCTWFQFVSTTSDDMDNPVSFVLTPMIDFEKSVPTKREAISYRVGSGIEVDLSKIGQFDLREIEGFSEFKIGCGMANVYRITPESLEKGIKTGAEVERFIDALARNSATDVPEVLRRNIISWANASVVSRDVVILRAETSIADAIMHTDALNKYVIKRLSPTILEVDGPSVGNLTVLLEEEICKPEVFDPDLLEGTVGKGKKKEKKPKINVQKRGGTAFALLADMDMLLSYLQTRKATLSRQMGVFPKKDIDVLMENFHIQDEVTAGRPTEKLFRRFAFIRHLATVGGLAKVERRINMKVRYRTYREEHRLLVTEKGRAFLGGDADKKWRTLFDIWARRIGWNPTLDRTDTPETRAWVGSDEGKEDLGRKGIVLSVLKELDPGIEHSYDQFKEKVLAKDATLGEVYLEMMLREPLYWLGVIDIRLHNNRMAAFRITEVGRRLLGRGAKLRYSADVVEIGGNYEFVASFEKMDPTTFYEIWRMADLVSSNGISRFKITGRSVVRARELGRSTEEILDFFKTISSTPLPQNVAHSIREWGDSYGKIGIRRAKLLRFMNESALEVFRKEHPEGVTERLSDRELIVLS